MSLGLTVNIIKTKFMVVGHDIGEEDTQPIRLEGGEIEHVRNFPYLGSSIAANGRIDDEIDRRIANTSTAFGILRQAVFKDANLSITTKTLVYQACVLSVLLYGGEWWIPLKKHPKKNEHLPPSLHPHHLRFYLHTTMGGAHFLQDDERAVGRRGDHNH